MSTASWTAATPRRTPARATSSSCSRRCASTASARSPPSMAATTPWIATASGTAQKKAFDAMVHGKAEASYADPVRGMKESYDRGVTDEFVIPFVCTEARGEPVGTIRDEDVVHQLQFPRRPRAADHALPGSRERHHRRGRARSSGCRGAGQGDSARRGAERTCTTFA